MLQAYWVDYEVWFRESSSWKYRNWVERYLVMPPFTNHDDAPEHDEQNHGNHPLPEFNEISYFEPSVDEPGNGGDESDNDNKDEDVSFEGKKGT